MAERWQQWMPFHIDKFRGSPEVQAMHPAARLGYIYLLASAWQSSDCSISGEALDLATESGLGDELWSVHGVRIMRKFRVRDDGRVTNDVLLVEWNEALRVYEKRRSGAVRTNSSRSAPDERTQTERPADTQTVTGTVTLTKKQKPSRDKREGDNRHAGFKDAFFHSFTSHNQIEPPWDGQEGKALSKFLAATPKITQEHWETILKHRFASEGANGDALSTWVKDAQRWYRSPLDRFGKPKEVANSTPKKIYEEPEYVTAARAAKNGGPLL